MQLQTLPLEKREYPKGEGDENNYRGSHRHKNRLRVCEAYFCHYSIIIRTISQDTHRRQQVTESSQLLQDGQLHMLHQTTLLLCQEPRKKPYL